MSDEGRQGNGHSGEGLFEYVPQVAQDHTWCDSVALGSQPLKVLGVVPRV